MKTYEGVETVSVIHAAMDDAISPTVVAMVEVSSGLSDTAKLEKAFMLTNSINDAWWNNKDVTPMFSEKGCRSTMVGDMVLIGTVKYKCDSMGWSKV